ncbi:MAG TPA: hypothetical protein VK463_21430 [Desulfomonilaceae bacterium]|nr:hypothetical protein [Desulfomonilaceae bacterium]
MAAKDKTKQGVPEIHPDLEKAGEKNEHENAGDIESLPLATARAIPRPRTSLAVPPTGKMGKLTVSLLGTISSVPTLEDVEKVNKAPGSQARTPLMTVIAAIVAKSGGSMPLEDLCAQIPKYWNRPLPATPYTLEEFVYVIVRNSDGLRIS